MKKKTKRPSKKRPRNNRKLPLLAAAIICEKVLQEEGNVVTAIRIVDLINLQGDSKEFIPGVVGFTILILFRSGEAIGKRTLELSCCSPSGETVKSQKQVITFEGGSHGQTLILNINLSLSETGTYWFDVKIGQQVMTRIPLTVNYQRIQNQKD